jgi:hypothetical protein
MATPQPKLEESAVTDRVATESRSNSTKEEIPCAKSQKELSLWRKIYNVLNWTPPNCRWDPEKPPQFSMSMSKLSLPDFLIRESPYLTVTSDVLFAFAAGFTVANLYYNHPILNILARDFGVRYEQVAQIPTVMQAGYAAGLLFLCPLGDLLPRRPFVCGLVFFTATMWCVLNYLSLPIPYLTTLSCWDGKSNEIKIGSVSVSQTTSEHSQQLVS